MPDDVVGASVERTQDREIVLVVEHHEDAHVGVRLAVQPVPGSQGAQECERLRRCAQAERGNSIGTTDPPTRHRSAGW